jgi:hypothetical protein
MNAPVIEAQGERTTTEMIKLARCSKLHRIIIAGERAAQQMFDLHRLGYNRVTTTRTCGHPREQYDVAFVDWHQRSVKLLSTTLDWLVCFLACPLIARMPATIGIFARC